MHARNPTQLGIMKLSELLEIPSSVRLAISTLSLKICSLKINTKMTTDRYVNLSLVSRPRLKSPENPKPLVGYRLTDRQTDRQTDTAPTAASRVVTSKNIGVSNSQEDKN